MKCNERNNKLTVRCVKESEDIRFDLLTRMQHIIIIFIIFLNSIHPGWVSLVK